MTDMPAYLTTAQVGGPNEMSTEVARRTLSRAGIIERLGGRWVVSSSKLRDRLPDMYERVFAHIMLRQAETRPHAR